MEFPLVAQGDLPLRLRQALRTHAWMFIGPPGSGKRTLARYYAMLRLCPSGEPCGECLDCVQVLSGNHPDVREITLPPDRKSIPIDLLREQLIEPLHLSPYGGRHKVYIIHPADKMLLPAQNALLKSLEEPPDFASILLLSAQPSALLPTLHSRCVPVRMKPLDALALTQVLIGQGIEPSQARQAASLGGGYVGPALALAREEGMFSRRDALLSALLAARAAGHAYPAVKFFLEEREMGGALLGLYAQGLRDALSLALGQTGLVVYPDQSVWLSEVSGLGAEKLLGLIQTALGAQQALQGNAIYRMAVEGVLQSWVQAFEKKEIIH